VLDLDRRLCGATFANKCKIEQTKRHDVLVESMKNMLCWCRLLDFAFYQIWGATDGAITMEVPSRFRWTFVRQLHR
jgi:hypothetical protein